jgi:hypothetical protein
VGLAFQFAVFVERELAMLFPAHSALSFTSDSLSELHALSLALLRIVQEISSSSPLPPAPPATHSPSHDQRSIDNEDASLLQALQSLSSTPLLDRNDAQEALELTEDQFVDRVADEQARLSQESV